MDIKSIAEQIISKLKSDPELMKQFQKEPGKTLEKLSGVDLPEDKIDEVAKTVMAKLASGEISQKFGSLFK